MVLETSVDLAILFGVSVVTIAGMAGAHYLYKRRRGEQTMEMTDNIKKMMLCTVMMVFATFVLVNLVGEFNETYPTIEFEREFTVVDVDFYDTGKFFTTEHWTRVEHEEGMMVFEETQTHFQNGKSYWVAFTTFPKQSLEEIPPEFGCELINWRELA